MFQGFFNGKLGWFDDFLSGVVGIGFDAGGGIDFSIEKLDLSFVVDFVGDECIARELVAVSDG